MENLYDLYDNLTILRSNAFFESAQDEVDILETTSGFAMIKLVEITLQCSQDEAIAWVQGFFDSF